MSNPNGPQPGSTPSGYSDLHDGGADDRFGKGDGLPNAVDENDSNWQTRASIAGAPNTSSPPGYFANPAPDPTNPYHGGAGTFSAAESALADYISGGTSGVYDNENRQPPDDPTPPSAADLYEDEAMGRSGTGRSV